MDNPVCTFILAFWFHNNLNREMGYFFARGRLPVWFCHSEGGFMIGSGAGIATGCIIGNIISGWAMLSIGMFIFGIITLLSNWATTYFYLI